MQCCLNLSQLPGAQRKNKWRPATKNARLSGADFSPLSHYIAPYPGSFQRSSTLIHVYKPLSSSHYCPKGRSYLSKIKRKPSQIKRVNLSFLKRQIYQKWVENRRFSRFTLPISKIFIPLSKIPCVGRAWNKVEKKAKIDQI